MATVGLEFLFVVLWSSGFIGAKFGLPYAGPFTLLFIRYGLVALFLSGPLLQEKVAFLQWIGMVVGLIGVVLVVGTKIGVPTDVSWVGYGLSFIATVSMTLATLYQRYLNRRQSDKTLPVISSLFVQATASAIALFPLALLCEDLQVQWTRQFIFALAWLVVVLSIGAYGLMLRLLEHCTAARVSSLMYLTPPVTLLLGFLAFGDALSWGDALGLGITVMT